MQEAGWNWAIFGKSREREVFEGLQPCNYGHGERMLTHQNSGINFKNLASQPDRHGESLKFEQNSPFHKYIGSDKESILIVAWVRTSLHYRLYYELNAICS